MDYGIVLIIAGLLAAPKLITGKSRQAEDLLKKIAPFQGWIGLVLFIWGTWGLISFILDLGWWMETPLLWWVTVLLSLGIQIILGILLGFNLIHKYILSKNAQAAEKGAALHKKLQTKQAVFGLIGVAVGVWTLIASFIW